MRRETILLAVMSLSVLLGGAAWAAEPSIVNGKKVNEATGCDVRAGKIGLQSEGALIHFRAVTLTPLEGK